MLVDREGRVEGSMHREVLDQFGKEVRLGSVLVLQRVAVLVTAARREYVNITLNNLVSIYTLPPAWSAPPSPQCKDQLSNSQYSNLIPPRPLPFPLLLLFLPTTSLSSVTPLPPPASSPARPSPSTWWLHFSLTWTHQTSGLTHDS